MTPPRPARRAAPALVALLIAAACAAPVPTPAAQAPTSAAPTAAPTVAQSAPQTAAPTPTARPTFPPGLYVVKPALDHPGGTIELLESAAPLPTKLDFAGVGFDVSAEVMVSTTFDSIVLTRPDGSRGEVKPKGLFAIGRPSLSPDSKQVFVQATETAFKPDPNVPRPLDDTVYIVDVASGAFRRIGDKPTSPMTQSEQPLWSPRGDWVAYWTTENNCLVVKVREAATAKDLLTIRRDGVTGCYQPQRGILDGPRFHVSASRDGSRVLIPGQMQLYDAKTGALVADLHQKVLDGVSAAGFKPDMRFPGAAGAGTIPLSGAFSPDDRTIVFDGAVEKDGQFGVILCRINVDGSGFAVMRGPVQVEPKFSNNHNFSQLLPHWLAAR